MIHMSDSEYSENLDVNGQDDNEGYDRHMQQQQQQQQRQQYNLELQRYGTSGQHQQLQQEQLLQQQNDNFMNYAGSTSSSAESSISSTSSDESDEGDSEDTLELAKITTEVLSLPRGLCENASIFHEFFSLETWQELPISVQNYLQQFLPNFSKILPPQLAAVEQTRTLSMLFNCELTRFNENPLKSLQQQLEVGNCRPDIIKLRQNILKSRRREQRFQQYERLSQTAKQLFLSRQRLLDTAYNSSPDAMLKPSITHNSHQSKPSHLFTDNKLSAIRARKRFYSEISQITKQLGFKDDAILSADEEDEDGLCVEEIKKDSQLQQRSSDEATDTAKTSTSLADRCVYSTIFKKLPEMEDEEACRSQLKSRQSKLTNRNFREYLREHKRRKLTEPTLPEFETSDIRLRDVCARAQMGGNFKRIFAFGKTAGRKPKTSATPTIPTTLSTTTTTTTPFLTTPTSSIASTATKSTICNTSMPTATTATQPITMKVFPPPPPTPLPPPPKLSEPPALVPIQPTLKKPETYQVVTATTTKSPHKEYQHHSNSTNTTNDPMNISQLMSVSNHNDNLNLCMDDSSLLAGDHDAFNMLDNEVELQQEEVETFAGTCEETLPAFVIGSDVVLPSSGNNNDAKGDLLNMRGNHQYQTKQTENIVSQPVPKLEPISRLPLIGQKLSNNSTTTASELIQETHACYFSLIRDLFCSTPNHRMRYDDLRHKIDVWLRNPITALNEWYSLTDNWSNLLRSAISFLVGEFPDLPEEYVPYIEHKIQLNIYQWIGAGRDSDTRLCELCTLWMEKRKQSSDKHTALCVIQNEHKLEVSSRSSLDSEDPREMGSDNGGGLTPPPPPPRCPTTWTVRAATQEEITEFQRQERDRFEQPHKAYTYRMHGYESVVGPVKGIYTPLLALSKARGHSMMVGDRPNFVTILTLVRDATARLPNGEGTRAEISELLKCSQYINRDASENVLQTIVSGALDRMHTEHDPCVRYDPKRKIWIYLHRNRSEEEFERIHQQNQTIGKTKKLPQRKPKPIGSNTSSSGSKTTDDSMNVLTSSEASNGSSSSSMITMPALVPSNPIIITNNVQRQQQLLQQQQLLNSNKCPPVPPLKYNIPPSQTNSNSQQQKSLLKTTIRADNKIISSTNTSSTSNITKQQQQHTFQVPQNKTNVNHNTTPIIVATPQGLQTVHVSNATSVMSSQNNNNSQQQSATAQQTSLTANLAGKRVTLNKPIIINQVTQQTSPSNALSSSTSAVSNTSNQKLKSSTQQLIQKSQLIQNRITLQTNQHQILTQQQQQSNLLIPISMANNMTLNVQSSNVADQTSSSFTSSTQISSSSSSSSSTTNQSPATLSNKQNIIRLVPAANVKTLMNSPSTTTTTQIVNRQRIIGNKTITDRPVTPQLHQQKSSTSGLQLLTNNGNVVTVASGSSNPAGSIVKMSAQQFASLQQKQSQQHIIVKQGSGGNKTQTVLSATNKPQRVILGNAAIMGQATQGKNIILQQIPVASSSVVVTPTQTSTSASAISTISGNKIQTINAKNLTPQQQRILVQNLKQQQQQQQQHHQQINQQTMNQNQIQFKTVQVIGNTTATQSNAAGRNQSATATTPKTVVVVSQSNEAQQQQQQQQQNITRILKTNSQLKSEISSSTAQGTRVITSSSGQIISLDSLIQKQGGTLRLASTGNAQTIKTNQHLANVIQKSQQQQLKQQQTTQQYAIVSVPNSIISLGSNSNFTVGQRIITTQAGSNNTTSLINLDTTKVTPSVVSTGTGRVITATTSGTKIITKQPGTAVQPGNIRVINTINQTGNINLATLQGKQVVLASGKTMNTITKAQLQSQQQQQQQNMAQAQTGSIVIGGQTVKLQQGNTNIQQLLQKGGSIVTNQGSASNLTGGSTQLQTVLMGNQIVRVQQFPQIVSTGNRLNVSNTKAINNNMDNSNITSTNASAPKTIFVGSTGQTLRLQPASSQNQTISNKNIIVQSQQQQQNQSTIMNKTTTSANANSSTSNRVVLAVQGGGQIFLSPNFQGGNINLKSLQNMKVVSLAQQKSSSTLTAQQQAVLKTTSTTTTASDTNI